MKSFLVALVALAALVAVAHGQIVQESSGAFCAEATQICDSIAITGSLENIAAPEGNDYGCLLSQPRPNWFYVRIADGSGFDFQITSTIDIDFALWGPFGSLDNATDTCGALPEPADCSYRSDFTEMVNFPPSKVDEVFLLMIQFYESNFTTATVIGVHAGGDGGAQCDIDPGACCTFGPTSVDSCNEQSATGCVADGGVFQGVGTTCGDICTSQGGCTDPGNPAYDASAMFDDGSCTVDIPGCTDTAALNYNPAANNDDGSCVLDYTYVCAKTYAANYAPVTTEFMMHSDDECVIYGCMDTCEDNYDPEATIDDDLCFSFGSSDPDCDNYSHKCGDEPCQIFGCLDMEALNYDSSANVNCCCEYDFCIDIYEVMDHFQEFYDEDMNMDM